MWILVSDNGYFFMWNEIFDGISKQRTSAQIPIKQHTKLKMARRKSLQTMSEQPKFAAKAVANEMWCLKTMYRPALTGGASIFDMMIVFSNLLLKKITCYVTDQPSTTQSRFSKICPKFQVAVLIFLRLMSCKMRIEQKLCKEKKIQL